MRKIFPETQCPCQSGKAFKYCCGRFLVEGAEPETAEELMRSRFSAFALRSEDWLEHTWAAETMPAKPLCTPGLFWTGLEVHEAGDMQDGRAFVDFTAKGTLLKGKPFAMREKSLFEKRDGRWVYLGEIKR